MRSFGESFERSFGERGEIGGFRQFEGELAKLRGRAAHLRDARILLFARREKFGLTAAVGDGRRLADGQHAGRFVRFAGKLLARFRSDAADSAAAVAERFRELVDEHQLRVSDADYVAGLQHVIAVDQLRPDQRSVAAVEIAHRPLPPDMKTSTWVRLQRSSLITI